MLEVNRRRFLEFLGVTGGFVALDAALPRGLFLTGSAVAQPLVGNFVPAAFTSVRLPHDLQWYVDHDSYLPTSGSTGTTLTAPSTNLATYTVFDDVVVPPEYDRYVILAWGQNVFPNAQDYVGFNCDWTGYRPIDGDNEGYLTVNHEYVGFPIARLAPATPSSLQTAAPAVKTASPEVIGIDLDAVSQQERWGEFMYNQGMSVVRIRRNTDGRYEPVVGDLANRRIHGLSGLAINKTRTDLRPDGVAFSTITSWGPASYQTGDKNYLVATGPAATQVYPKSVDGAGARVIGTAYNCSGGYTPWGTSLSCEENFQGTPNSFFIGVREWVNPDGTQVSWLATDPNNLTTYTAGAYFGLVGEKYGLVVEVDPRAPNARNYKHTALGRFRHENVTLRCRAGEHLIAYMGDDRRAGHTYKFVSTGVVTDPASRTNSKLLRDGILYVAHFDTPDDTNVASGTGRWIPLLPSTPVNPNLPSQMGAPDPVNSASVKKLELPTRTFLQAAIAAAGAAYSAPNAGVGFPFRVIPDANEAALIDAVKTAGGTKPAGATLADYYDTLGAILTDCYLAANLVGGTSTGRPEDLEINPRDPGTVFIAYTDGLPASASTIGDAYPDARVFRVAKYGAAVDSAQGAGGLYKIVEEAEDGSGTTFTWERFLQGGEDGAKDAATASNAAVDCDGFAQIDNMAFDDAGNLWLVTDMSTSSHNGFSTTYTSANGKVLQPGQRTINHAGAQTGGDLVGVFGNNWLICVPIEGADAGKVIPFGYGPPRSEMTGPTFVGDTLILSVQHPSEDSPINGDPAAGGTADSIISRDIEMLALDGTLYIQTRTLPRGSNFPSNIPQADGGGGLPVEEAPEPLPCVVGIRRKPVPGTPNG